MKWNRGVVALLGALLAVSAGVVHATAQVSDVILIEGKERQLNTNPLERHLRALGDKAPRFDSPHTANWRGYVATWELAAGKLHLRSIEGYRRNPSPDDDEDTDDLLLDVDGMAELFPGQADVVADWYTGALIIPDGEMVDYVHMGYGSTYERYIVSVVRQGIELKRLHLSEREFRDYREERFETFKSTAAYRAMIADMKAREASEGGAYALSDEQMERFVKEYSAEEYLSMVDGVEAP